MKCLNPTLLQTDCLSLLHDKVIQPFSSIIVQFSDILRPSWCSPSDQKVKARESSPQTRNTSFHDALPRSGCIGLHLFLNSSQKNFQQILNKVKWNV